MIMIYQNKDKYTFTELAALNFKIAPGYAGIMLLQNVIEGILPSLLALAISFFIDSFNANRGGRNFIKALLVVVCIMVMQHIVSALFSFAHRGLRTALQRVSDYEGIERIASLEYLYIEEREKYENTSRVTGGMANYIFSSYQIILTTISLITRVISLAVIFFRYNVWWVGIVIVLFAVPVFVLSYGCGEKVYKFYKNQYSHSLQMNHQTYILKSRETVLERTLFEYSDQIGENWGRLRNDYFKKQLALHLHAERELKISSISSCILLGLLIVPIIAAYFEKAITVGLLMTMVGNLVDLNSCMNQALSPMASKVSEVKGFLRDLNRFLKYSFEPEYLAVPSDSKVNFKSLEFEDVTFCYPNSDRKVLNHLSFQIKDGNSYAFVGKNGSGKSTIIKLILGLYQNYDGRILLNGGDIKEYSASELKSIFGVMFQDYAKYQISLKENIELGTIYNREEISRRRDEALKKMKMGDLLRRLPGGLKTNLGKLDASGQDVSGGEWQRIAIARLLTSEKQVYILDEPTSSIDPLLEGCIFDWFSNAGTNTAASVVISHRLGITRTVDKVFVVDQGKIVEQGTYMELMRNRKLFYDMYTKQQGRFV